MDEPFAAVDAQTRMTLQEELGTIALRSQLTVLFITHSVEEAIFLGDRVAVMTPGPGRIRTIVDVPFAREARTWAQLNADPAFARDARRIARPRAARGGRAGRPAGRLTVRALRIAPMLRCRWRRPVSSSPSLAAWWIAAFSAAERKLAPLGALPAERGSYRITLDFAPERFHQLRLQETGRLVEVRERTVYMMDVAPAALRGIAGEYWVDGVARWDGK